MRRRRRDPSPRVDLCWIVSRDLEEEGGRQGNWATGPEVVSSYEHHEGGGRGGLLKNLSEEEEEKEEEG